MEGGLPFDHNGDSLGRAEIRNLACELGEFNISFRPAAFPGGFADLDKRAHTVNLARVELKIADLGDVIRSKEAAGRPKDLRVLPTLYRFSASHRDGG